MKNLATIAILVLTTIACYQAEGVVLLVAVATWLIAITMTYSDELQ